MENNGLQGIAEEAKNHKSGLKIFHVIGAIIFIIPIVGHSIKWGWLFPLISLAFFEWWWEDYGILGLIFAILIFAGSLCLCVWRVRTMRKKRKFENIPQLSTPPSMRDDD